MKMHFDGEALRYLDNLTLRMQKAEAEVERLRSENAQLRRELEGFYYPRNVLLEN